jgi:DNA-binding CsgD family transcriptional regulator
MNRWQVELFESLREAATPTEISGRLAWATTEMGFDHFSCGLWATLPLSNPSIDFSGNAPPEWQLKYHQERFAQRDPIVRHARRSLDALAWTDEVFAGCPELAMQAHASGLCTGWTQAYVNAHGRRGMLSLTRRRPLLGATELRQKDDDMRWLATMTQLFVSSAGHRHQHRSSPAERPGDLTEREAEVLRWSGDGKTIGETASILAISENTVNFHLRNAVSKLNAANKTSAVVIALTNGLLAH